jgi:5-methylcytosine-specific restriction enzyme subunit McrC
VIPRIPIRNLYFIFCYAWNRAEEGGRIDVGIEDSPDLLNLLAKLMAAGVKRLLRRGLFKGYLARTEPLGALTGRVKLVESLSQIARRASERTCEFDVFEVDILPNQILKAAMSRLIRTAEVEEQLVADLKLLCRRFDSVRDIHLTQSVLCQVPIHRNNATYEFLLRICRLINEATLPDSSGRKFRFQDILRDEVKMAQIFEEFIRNFYRHEQEELEVIPLQIRWDTPEASPGDVALLPLMRTDIHLRNAERAIIVDTKYYLSALQERFGKQTVHSSNLYQIFAYLKNAERLGEIYKTAEGILLYPTVGYSVDAQVTLQGHAVRVKTIDLGQPWQQITRDLLELLQEKTALPKGR